MSTRLRVWFLPSTADFGPYRSLVRLEQSTREALARHFDVHEGPEPPERVDAVVDLGASLRHVGRVGRAPALVFALGNLPVGAPLLWRGRNQLRSTDLILLNSTADVDIFHRVVRAGGPGAALLPLGVDCTRFRPRGSEHRLRTRAELGIPEDAFVLIHAGRLDAQKNVHALLSLMRELVPRERRALLLLAGAFGSMPNPWFPERRVADYEPEMRAWIRGWGLEQNVGLLGPLDDEPLASALSASDAFLSFTLHCNENFGYAPVEAMASGIPAVVSHWGGLKDTVRHEETGFLVETVMTARGPRAVWRQAIEPLLRLARDPDLGARMGAAGRDRVEAHYSLAAYTRTLATLVESAVARARTLADAPTGEPRFSREAMDWWLLDLHRRARRSPAPDGAIYAAYRWFQSPYASHDVSELKIQGQERLLPLVRLRLDRRMQRLEIREPLWSDSRSLDSAEMELVGTLELAASLPPDSDRSRAFLQGLLEQGIAFPDRPFRS